MREELLKKVCSKVAKMAERNVEENPVTYSPFIMGYEIEIKDEEK